MRCFPLFLSLEGRTVAVIGGGSVAARRVEKLLPFGCAVTVVAPEGTAMLAALAAEKKIRWLRRPYRTGDCAGAFLVLAATGDPAVNQTVCREAKALGIPVNTADDKAACDFYFPGLVVTEELVIGVTASGKDHGLVKRTVEELQQFWKEASEDEGTG